MTLDELYELIREAERAGIKNQFDDAEKMCLQALDVIEKMRIAATFNENEAAIAKAKVLNIRAVMRLINNDLESAANYASLARELAETNNDLVELVTALGTLGIVHNELTDFTKALEYQESALKFARQIGNPQRILRVKGNLGALYYRLEKYDEALKIFEQSLTSTESELITHALAATLSNIGSIYQITNKPDEALTHFQKALTINQELGDKKFEGINLNNIGLAYYDKKEFLPSIQFFKAAIEVAQKTGDKSLQASAYNHLASAIYEQARSDENRKQAMNYLYQSIQLAEEANDYLTSEKSHRKLSQWLEEIKDIDNAFKHYKEAYQLEKKYVSDETKKQATMLLHRQNIEQAERDRQVKLARFQEQEKILHNMLPATIADRILEGEKTIADKLDEVSVFFSDIVNFTQISQSISPEELVEMLNEIFSAFDSIAQKYGLEKIKTIGDAYMAVAGAPMPQSDHAERTAGFALEVMQAINDYSQRTGNPLEIRVGLHCGHAVAGIIGKHKFAYDLWGDAINTASRMESHGMNGKIHVSEDFRNALKESAFEFTKRGEMEVKGKGKMTTYFLDKQNSKHEI